MNIKLIFNHSGRYNIERIFWINNEDVKNIDSWAPWNNFRKIIFFSLTRLSHLLHGATEIMYSILKVLKNSKQ